MQPNQIPEPYRSMDPTFRGARFSVYSMERKGSDGRTHKREAVIHPGAVVILPLLDPQTILLIRNRRFVVNEILWELPAGTRELSETPQTTAEREVLEETGYRAGTVQAMTQFYTTPGFCNEEMFAFLATDLSHEGQNLDEGEEIDVESVSLSNALHWIQEGTIKDGKTIATLLYYQLFVHGAQP